MVKLICYSVYLSVDKAITHAFGLNLQMKWEKLNKV